MKDFTMTEARRRPGKVLDEAQRGGAVRIRRQDGRAFVITPEKPSGSPLDVEGVDLGMTADEIVRFVREGRARNR